MTEGTAAALSGLTVVGANHRSGPTRLRDALFLDAALLPGFLAQLRGAGVRQALVLSTCDRVEVQTAGGDPGRDAETVRHALADRAGLAPADLDAHLYRHEGASALRHVFAVAASLDSLVIGEPQVLGQVRAGHEISRAAGMAGAELDMILSAAYAAAKRVRGESAIAEGPVSIAAAAVQVARSLHGDLAACTALLVGAADMAEIVATQLRRAGLRDLVVASPTPARADSLAARLDAHICAMDELPARLAAADIVLASMGTGRYQFGADAVAAALKARRRKPIFLVDLAMPGDVDPAVDALEEAFLYGLADLEAAAMQGQAARRAAADAAWAILDEEVAAFLRRGAEREAAPAITALRARFEAARRQVLAEEGGADVDRATRLLVNRLLHAPSVALRRARGEGGRPAELEAALRDLFDLKEMPASGTEKENRDED